MEAPDEEFEELLEELDEAPEEELLDVELVDELEPPEELVELLELLEDVVVEPLELLPGAIPPVLLELELEPVLLPKPPEDELLLEPEPILPDELVLELLEELAGCSPPLGEPELLLDELELEETPPAKTSSEPPPDEPPPQADNVMLSSAMAR
ncbi:histone-lysine N-methyltransferase MLL2 [Alteromonadaceae bacterium Bs31]|nr:histone-lysine N-methyltransferase MLL2 [Alteromonadaceae bacterium Bs31]SMF61168.1 histone-lysine N-methyltransferase MLL2 [Alteromonadaceae bacterium Bs31]